MELKGITLQYDIPSQTFMGLSYSFALSKGSSQEVLHNFRNVLQSLKDIIDDEFEEMAGVKKEESGTVIGYEANGRYGYTEEKVSSEKGPAFAISLSYALKCVTEVKEGAISIQHRDNQDRLLHLYDRFSEFQEVSHGLLAKITMRRIAELRDGATWIEALESKML